MLNFPFKFPASQRLFTFCLFLQDFDHLLATTHYKSIIFLWLRFSSPKCIHHRVTYVYASKSPVLMLSISCSVILMISWRRAGIVNRLSICENGAIGAPDRSYRRERKREREREREKEWKKKEKKIESKTIRAHTDTSYGTTVTCTNLYQLLRPTPKAFLSY